MRKKALPVGISDFKTLIEKNYYYFDKTKLIEELLIKKSGVTLFTRPRRFGKTLNMSMLKYFFDMENKDENQKLFKNLYISKSRFFQHQGQNPVIFLSFKDIKASSWDECNKELRNLISELYKDNKYLIKNIDKYDLKEFEDICFKVEESDWKNSLKKLSKFLYEYYGKKVIVLIDEYDTPIIYSYTSNYYNEAMDFFRHFYGTVLKDNEYLEFSVMTGINRVAKEGIFSGLNNLAVYSIMDKKYSEYFGFLENEVEKSLKYYEYEYRINQVREWYDGYKFGENQIYNPWSIINFLSNNELKAYWINTSNNDLISYYLEKADKQMIEDLEKLFNKEKIYKVINDFINFSDLDNNYNDEIWQLFLYSGYITIDGKVENMLYPLTIPNKEIYQFFGNTFVRNFFKDQSGFIYLTQYLEQKNIDKFEEKLNEMLEKYVSYHDTGKYKEQFYHGLVMGIVSFLQDKYEFPSNRESGSGRTDLMLIPKNKNKTGFILEFKVAENEDKLEIRAIEALHQIEHNKYDTELKTKDIKDIVNIGVAFYGKKAKVKYKNNKY